jgi:hypothetical protein
MGDKGPVAVQLRLTLKLQLLAPTVGALSTKAQPTVGASKRGRKEIQILIKDIAPSQAGEWFYWDNYVILLCVKLLFIGLLPDGIKVFTDRLFTGRFRRQFFRYIDYAILA